MSIWLEAVICTVLREACSFCVHIVIVKTAIYTLTKSTMVPKPSKYITASWYRALGSLSFMLSNTSSAFAYRHCSRKRRVKKRCDTTPHMKLLNAKGFTQVRKKQICWFILCRSVCLPVYCHWSLGCIRDGHELSINCQWITLMPERFNQMPRISVADLSISWTIHSWIERCCRTVLGIMCSGGFPVTLRSGYCSSRGFTSS